MKIFLDDIRDPPDHTWMIARSYYEFLGIILSEGLVHVTTISFDYHLGDSKRNGYNAASWLANHISIRGARAKKVHPSFRFSIHSSSEAGEERIRRVMNDCFARLKETKTREIKSSHHPV